MSVETGVVAGNTADQDVPRLLLSRPAGSDRVFRAGLRLAGCSVLAITGLIGVFLVKEAWSALQHTGLHFLSTKTFNPAAARFGIASLLPNGAIIAVIALVVATPVALGTALFISEYAPRPLRRPLISLVDLMAAIPSILYGLWGVTFLAPRVLGTSQWLSEHVAFIPVFQVPGQHTQTAYNSSTFIAGLVVALMVIPIIASISREVFSQAPVGEREAAYALGSTRWGMIRTVVLPYGRGGMIGAIMLGFGRAMGETIAIALIISPTYDIAWRILENHGSSIASLIALRYSESTPQVLSALMAAGLVLFAVTLAVNALAGIIVSRSRSGAETG